MKRIILSIFVLSAVFLGGIFTSPRASALSGSEFQAGRIMDDGVFFNPSGVSASEIQNFLNSKVPSCDTNGTQPYGGTTRAAYGTSRGYPPPYICLKDYSQATPSKAAEPGLCDQYNGGTKSSAQIIFDVAQSCGINPRVLLVLLQKEQSLVTDSWPWSSQYRAATGYGCPDTAPCDSEYYGFFNQVYMAARQFKKYARDPSNYSHKAYFNNFVRYNPNSSCGGSTVYLQNQATAGLYNYTPYQPNQSALNNLYGTGDGCSAYGNRNFWRMYQDWFGNTIGANFSASYVRQSPYLVIDSGNRRSIFFEFKNTGIYFWKDDTSVFSGYLPIRIATSNPLNNESIFYADDWLNKSRPTGTLSRVYESDGTTLAADQHTVMPNQIGRYEFTLYANPAIPSGVYRQYFQPVLDGAPNPHWNLNSWAYIDVGIHKPNYSASFHKQSSYPTINKGGSSLNFFEFKNTGSDAWFDNVSKPEGKSPIRLATTSPINRVSLFGDSWGNKSRPAVNFSRVYESDGVTLTSNQHVVYPGQIARFEFGFNVPVSMSSGYYKEYFELVAEGSPGWRIGPSGWLGVTVP